MLFLSSSALASPRLPTLQPLHSPCITLYDLALSSCFGFHVPPHFLLVLFVMLDSIPMTQHLFSSLLWGPPWHRGCLFSLHLPQGQGFAARSHPGWPSPSGHGWLLFTVSLYLNGVDFFFGMEWTSFLEKDPQENPTEANTSSEMLMKVLEMTLCKRLTGIKGPGRPNAAIAWNFPYV